MKNKCCTIILVLLFLLISVSAAKAQKAEPVIEPAEGLANFTFNDQLVLNAMRSIHSAEIAFASTFGNGNFATLQNLQQAELIDAALASGQKYGYRFSINVRFATATMQPGFDVTATPGFGRPRDISFYMNEGCDIRGAERRGRDASITDPVIEPCGFSLRSENERLSIASLRVIHSAQMTYMATFGAGHYGTPAQLYNTTLVTSGFILSYIWRGYTASFTVTPSTPTEPPHFTVSIVPTQYGRTGVRSFFIDETGVLRGADKNGLPAGPTDPPVNN